ncbi:MAG: DUF350 domain-containing protein [Elusimicrobiota bacterium]|jgi:uncharacterized membrane protein YjfL (UPF0719 family)
MTKLLLSIVQFALSVGLSALVVYLTYEGFKRTMPHMDAEEEIRKGNAAVAIMIGALMIGSALILQESVYPIISICTLVAAGECGCVMDFLRMAGYALGHLVLGMLLAMGCVRLALEFFERLTGDMNEDLQVRKGNTAVALMMAAVVIVLSVYMRSGASAVTKALIPQPSLGSIENP